jgi:hypothetical protein
MKDVAALAEALKELLDATPEARRLEALDAVCLDGVSDKALRRHFTQRGFLVGCGKLREAAMVALAASAPTVTVTLTPRGLACLLDELAEMPGFDRMVRDDSQARLEEAIDRLEQLAIAQSIMVK